LDTVKGSTHSETEKETGNRAGAGNVVAPASPDRVRVGVRVREKRKPLDDDEYRN
jgi:hypothetical protein